MVIKTILKDLLLKTIGISVSSSFTINSNVASKIVTTVKNVYFGLKKD